MKSTELFMNYDLFASTFSQSRKDHPWPEVDHIIEDMKQSRVKSILDIGCGNGRFLEEAEKQWLEIERYLGTDNSEGMIEEARSLHPWYDFVVAPMEELRRLWEKSLKYDALLFLASYHHLTTYKDRRDTLIEARKFLSPNWRIYMTNWNLRDQRKYDDMKTSEWEYQIKIGAYTRYYHGFHVSELTDIFEETGYKVVEHSVFSGGRNILSIITPR